MEAYKIRKATTNDKDLILDFYSRYEDEISTSLKKVREFFDATAEIEIILIQNLCQDGNLGKVIAGCVAYCYTEEGIKYGCCSTGLVLRSQRRKGFSQVLYKKCEDIFRQKGCQKVRNLRNTQMKHINLKKLKEQNWKINVIGKMIIMEKDL